MITSLYVYLHGYIHVMAYVDVLHNSKVIITYFVEGVLILIIIQDTALKILLSY